MLLGFDFRDDRGKLSDLMQGLIAGELKIDVVDADDAVRLIWLGKSNERQPDKALAPFFGVALEHAGARKIPIELHFESLEHFNSSTIASIIQLIQEARSRENRLVIVFDPSRKWQKLSFDALRVFVKADGLFELQTVEAKS